MSVERTAPETGPDSLAERGRARTFDAAEQEIAHKRRVAPRHRGAVRRFFSSEKKKEEKK